MVYFIFKKVLGPLIRIIWIKKVEHLERIPKSGAAILAFNHNSYFDFLCFVAISPRMVQYLAAEKFFVSKFWKPIMESTGQIEVKRKLHDKRDVHERVYNCLSKGGIIGIFPEGTRSMDGELLPAFGGVSAYAVKAGVPVIPIGIKGTFDILHRFSSFPKFKKNVEINIGEAIKFEKYKDIKLNKRSYNVLADEIMKKIAKLCDQEYPYHTSQKETKEKKHHLVIFDLDNTLIFDQSQKLLIMFMVKKKILSKFYFIKGAIWFFLYKLNLINNPDSALRELYWNLKGLKLNDWEDLLFEFAKEEITPLFLDNIVGVLKDHKKHEHIILLISNTPNSLLKIIAKYLNVPNYIGTELEVKDGVLTGNICGQPMYGVSRVKAVKNFIKKSHKRIGKTWAYSDHVSDIPLLSMVDFPTVVNPNSKFKKIATRTGWPIIANTK